MKPDWLVFHERLEKLAGERWNGAMGTRALLALFEPIMGSGLLRDEPEIDAYLELCAKLDAMEGLPSSSAMRRILAQ